MTNATYADTIPLAVLQAAASRYKARGLSDAAANGLARITACQAILDEMPTAASRLYPYLREAFGRLADEIEAKAGGSMAHAVPELCELLALSIITGRTP